MSTDTPAHRWFRAAFEEARRSADTLRESLGRVALPATPEGLDRLDTDAKDRIDAFVLRFLRLQDALGRQVFRALLALEQEDEPDALSQLDVLDRMERLGIVPSVEAWSELRRLRNMLTHDYPEHPELRLEALRKALAGSALLLEVLERVGRRAAERHGLNPAGS